MLRNAMRATETPMVATIQASQQQNGYRDQQQRQPTALMLLAPLTLIMFLQQREDMHGACEEVTRADVIRGKYENKIRYFSPPEKSFEIFASERTEDGELRMSYKDFLRAMTPFVYTPFFEETDKYLEAHMPMFLKKVDADNDGTISYTEYFFFLTLFQIPESRLRRVWKKFPEGKMSKDQASQTLLELRKQTQAGLRQKDKTQIDARAIKATEEDFKKTNLMLVEILFKGKTHLTVRDMLELQEHFKEALWHYMFHTLGPNEKGRISTESFLQSHLSSLSGSSTEKYRK